MKGPTTPYYLAGSSAQRYHEQKAQKHTKKALGYGAVAGAMTQPGIRDAAAGYISNGAIHHIHSDHAKAFSAGFGFAAAGHAGQAARHKAKAQKIQKVQVAKRAKAVKK